MRHLQLPTHFRGGVRDSDATGGSWGVVGVVCYNAWLGLAGESTDRQSTDTAPTGQSTDLPRAEAFHPRVRDRDRSSTPHACRRQ